MKTSTPTTITSTATSPNPHPPPTKKRLSCKPSPTPNGVRRDFSNLALQERRLRNHLEKDTAELQTLQKQRLDRRKNEIALSIKQGPGFNPADCGFDFSSEELHYYLDRTATHFRLMQTRPDFDKVIAAYRTTQKEPQAA